MMFNETFKDLGTIQAGKTVKIEFPFNDGYFITKLSTPCDCTVANIDNKNRKVLLDYTPNPVPMHLKEQGFVESNKTVDISFGLSETGGMATTGELILKFKAIVKDTL